MARFNQQGNRNHSRRNHERALRRESLLSRGVDLAAIAAAHGVGLVRACTIAEEQLGLAWRGGNQTKTPHHAVGAHK